jgi:hypothetical protein
MAEVTGTIVLVIGPLHAFNVVRLNARAAIKRPTRNLLLCNPIKQKTNAAAETGIRGRVPRCAATVVLAATVRVAVAGAPVGVTDGEEKAHDNLAGSPVHPKDTA